MRIGVDVDLCVVDTGILWSKWLEKTCNKSLPEQDTYDYDLTRYFQRELQDLQLDGFEFWRGSDLYDKVLPIKHSAYTLKSLSREHEIVFISALKGNHHKSKVNFIKKFFPFYSAFIGTKEKGYVDVDVMIDDRLDNLHLFNDVVFKILYHTPYRQTKELTDDIKIAYDWQDVKFLVSDLTGVTENV